MRDKLERIKRWVGGKGHIFAEIVVGLAFLQLPATLLVSLWLWAGELSWQLAGTSVLIAAVAVAIVNIVEG